MVIKRIKAGHYFWLSGAILAIMLFAGNVLASDFSTYGSYTAVVDVPEAGGDGYYSWFTTVEYFPQSTTAMIGNFAASGRLIAATGRSIYLQRNYGSSQWDVVATIARSNPSDQGGMDPSFIRISPDGDRIALGIGYGAPLLVFPTTLLSASSPPVLLTDSTPAAGVDSHDVNYYDAAWADNRYLVINGGAWPGPDYASAVGVVDTNNSTDTGVALVYNIPGASASVTVDAAGNLYTGVGHQISPNRTGEIKVWTASEWSKTPSAPLDYEANTRIVANNALSAAYLGTDSEGNLFVGGGDAFGVGGPSENGYAALISQAVIARVTDASEPGSPVDENDSGEYREFAPDPCADDSATGVLFGNWGKGLAVMWNPTYYEDYGSCYGAVGSALDYWLQGVRPRLTVYYTEDADDQDGDGVPDGADNAYLTANASQLDTDGDGYGNAADADFNNDGTVNTADLSAFRQAMGTTGVSQYDMTGDGTVNTADLSKFRQRYGKSAPYY